MLTLEQRILLKKLDSYINLSELKSFALLNSSAYILSFKEQKIINQIVRANHVYNLGLPVSDNKYKKLTLVCISENSKHQSGFEVRYSGVSS